MENIRNRKLEYHIIEYYKLNPSPFLSSSPLSDDAMLKLNDVKLELIWYFDMYRSVEKVMRSDISYISQKYSKTNKEFLNSYNTNKPSENDI